ncbi:hypothetical protein G6M50_38210 [Agrobacterium rhizogenes]|nr:hypothetical protein [Rhizobium rhizogenes]NTJ83622.1 hypothetical protein [Rhizobium rhizogenes]
MFEFPSELAPLRRYLEKNQADVAAFVSARQVAFIAQKLADLRVKFPKDTEASMLPTLLQIQREIVKKHKGLAKPSTKERKREARRKQSKGKLGHKEKVAAAKAPNWLRTAAASKVDPAAERQYRDSQLGSFGAASEVRRIDPTEYLKAKEAGERNR